MEADKLGDYNAALDQLSEGAYGRLRALCRERGWHLDLSVQTYLEGLGAGEMRLYFTGFDGDKTALFFWANLVGGGEILGWNLYLEEVTRSARDHLSEARDNLTQLAIAHSDIEETGDLDVDLFVALKTSLAAL